MTSPCLSLVVSTYNKPRELELSLASILESERASLSGLEILVADDGSSPETAALVERFARSSPIEVRHFHHEDHGFRLAAIRNRAIRAASGDILVFVDGDSLLRPEALLAHARRTRPGRAHSGSRCFLDEPESERLIAGALPLATAWGAALRRERWKKRGLFARNAFYRLTKLKTRPKFVGGNCAVHREDLERVNGFDERFVGWGLEDDDLARRLRRAGVRIADGTLDCHVLHLFHLTHPSHRPTIHHTENYRYYHRGGFLTRCRRGLRPRALADIAFRILEPLPSELQGLRSVLGSVADGDMAEVELAIGTGDFAGRGDSELRVHLEDVPETRGEDALSSCIRLLESRV